MSETQPASNNPDDFETYREEVRAAMRAKEIPDTLSEKEEAALRRRFEEEPIGQRLPAWVARDIYTARMWPQKSEG